MLRLLLPLVLVFALTGCDAFGSDSGDADLTLSGSRSGTLRGDAFIGTGSTVTGVSLFLRDDESGRVVTVDFPVRPAAGIYRVAENVAVEYSPGVLSDGYTGVGGTVTLTEASSGEIRGRLDVDAALFSSEPILQIGGTFRAVER